MKINKFSAAFLAAVVILSSCSKDEPATGTEGSETFASISIALPQTKAPDDGAGAGWEKVVSEIGVFIYDQTSYLVHSEYKGLSDFTQTGNSYKANFAVKTTEGTKDILVVINPTAALKTKLQASTTSAINAVAFAVAQSEFVTAGTSIVMSGLLKDQVVPGGISETDAQNATNTKTVQIYRNLSKFALEVSPTLTVPGGTMTLQYTSGAIANDAYFSQQATTLYYDVPASLTTDAERAAYFAARYSPVNNVTTGYVAVPDLNTSKIATTGGFYAFENEHDATDGYYYGNTTCFLIRGQFTPTSVVNTYDPATQAKTTGTIATGASFYIRKIDSEFWSEAAYASATTGAGADHTAADFTAIYDQGYCYYYAPVQDDTNSDTYGVKRNHFYVSQITKINRIGYPGTDWKPEDPITKVTYLSIEAIVNPWDWQISEIELP